MPIPSIVPSSSANNSITVRLPVVTITTPPLEDQQQQQQDDSKCKHQSTIKASSNLVNNNNIETEASYNAKQHVKSCRKTNNQVVLLHARREHDDKVVNINEDRLRPVCASGLYAGSVFHGTQKCGTSSYEVNVELLVSLSLRVCVCVLYLYDTSFHCASYYVACGYEGEFSLWLFKD